mmetsp:Transcript_5513/g.19906  ORF Transcript_5513/g.19906 Transcript_5513/m.19906 type:complete len:256 (+) Transcript_5513:1505-2272(+)
MLVLSLTTNVSHLSLPWPLPSPLSWPWPSFLALAISSLHSLSRASASWHSPFSHIARASYKYTSAASLLFSSSRKKVGGRWQSSASFLSATAGYLCTRWYTTSPGDSLPYLRCHLELLLDRCLVSTHITTSFRHALSRTASSGIIDTRLSHSFIQLSLRMEAAPELIDSELIDSEWCDSVSSSLSSQYSWSQNEDSLLNSLTVLVENLTPLFVAPTNITAFTAALNLAFLPSCLWPLVCRAPSSSSPTHLSFKSK